MQLRTRGLFAICCCFCLMLICAFSSLAQSPQIFSPTPEADSLYKEHKWAEAAKAYEAVTQKDAGHGRAWYRLGMSLHAMGKYDQAVNALKRAVEITKRPAMMYNLAAALARSNQKDESLMWLLNSLNRGFAPGSPLETEADFFNLHDEPRFKEASALADKIARPCMFKPEHRQFDFWIGEWNVLNPAGDQVGTSSILNVAEGCIILENWTNLQGQTGKSLNFYNSVKGKWQQTWVGHDGDVLELAGEYKDGAMLFTGETIDSTGKKTLEKLTFFNLSAERVRQLWQQSTDGGKTWMVVFDGLYIRRK